MKILSDIEKAYVFEEEWGDLINKHRIRFDIWALLELHNELNVTQISHYVEQGKTTVARHLKLMEKDGLLLCRKPKNVIKGRIPPKIYRINPKFKKEEEKEENFYKKVINHYRKTGYNISKLLRYLDPLLNLLERKLDYPKMVKVEVLHGRRRYAILGFGEDLKR